MGAVGRGQAEWWERTMTALCMTPRRAAVVLAASLGLSGCDFVVNPDGSSDRADYSAALRQWRATEPRGYEFTLETSCFCVVRSPVTFTVRDGYPVAARDAYTGAPLPARYPATVDDLFQEIRTALRDADEVRADYDPVRGFPTYVRIDYDRRTAADETVYRVTGFRVTY